MAEKDIQLKDKNYIGWNEGDIWLDLGKQGDIDQHPINKEERFRSD